MFLIFIIKHFNSIFLLLLLFALFAFKNFSCLKIESDIHWVVQKVRAYF